MAASRNHTKIPLGRSVPHRRTYDPGQLYPISRAQGRIAEGLGQDSFGDCFGEDIWNIYELSWLDSKGKPAVAMAEIRVPLQSPNLIESKSVKLYLNSFNMTVFATEDAVCGAMIEDLSKAAGHPVKVLLIPPEQFSRTPLADPEGICIDDQSIEPYSGKIDPSALKAFALSVKEVLFSRLFRSVCPVTGQPDYATISIGYEGGRICRKSLLSYLVSFREHPGFHEACVERIFHDILNYCRPDRLLLSARFTRRGGIDINPYRATYDTRVANLRHPRQ